MSKPLTEEQKQIISWSRFDLTDNVTGPAAIDAALARLDFLERKLLAAEQLARKLATSNCLMVGISKTHDAQIEKNRKAIDDYDEVDEDTVPGMEP